MMLYVVMCFPVVNHLLNWHKPKLQGYIIGVLLMVCVRARACFRVNSAAYRSRAFRSTLALHTH